MITEVAKERCRVLAFWEKHGEGATTEAFNISRATLFRWQKSLQENKGKLEGLNKRSTAPKKRRVRYIPEGVEDYIMRERMEHPRLSKEKLATMMKDDLHTTLSFSKVGRIMRDMKKRNILPLFKKQTRSTSSTKKKKRRNGFIPEAEGEFIEIDTVVKHINGEKRYTLTAIDVYGRYAFAYSYKHASSATATDFLKKLQLVAPFSIKRIQTDNGSEFAKHFVHYLEVSDIVHFHTYPRCPKMNAHIERFNRTIQEEHLNWNLQTLAFDIDRFNLNLKDWIYWYNTKRPHISLGYLAPIQYIKKQLVEKSQR
jgi:transposase InsO family protein